MRAISLKIKSYNQSIRIVDNGNLQRRILHILLLSSLVLGLCYVLILGSMVFNIVERRSLEAQARTLGSEVGDLELSFLSLSNNIDLPFSYSLGFKEANVKFATRKAVGSLGGSKNVKLAQNEI